MVTDYKLGRIEVFDAQGTQLYTFANYGVGSGKLKRPTALALGPNGEVYVVDQSRNDLQRFTSP